jgi:hypothetical protein
VRTLVSRYHDDSAPDGRDHRLVIAAHPLPVESSRKKQPESDARNSLDLGFLRLTKSLSAA